MTDKEKSHAQHEERQNKLPEKSVVKKSWRMDVTHIQSYDQWSFMINRVKL